VTLQEPRKLTDCGCFPTPLHRLNRLSKELGCNIFLKRDDLTGIGFSGNKISIWCRMPLTKVAQR